MTETPAPNASQPEGKSQAAPSSEASGGVSDPKAKPADGKVEVKTEVVEKPVKPEGLADSYWDADKGELKTADLIKDHTELSTKAAAEAERRKGLPAKADDYKIELPKDIEAPPGFEMVLDAQGEVATEFKAMVHEYGLTQDAATKLVGLLAKNENARIARVDGAVKLEVAKLGDNGMARIDAVKAGIMSIGGEEAYKALAPMLFTANQVVAMETLIRRATSGGVPSFTVAGRETKYDGKLTEEQYEKMSSTEKLAYARIQSAKSAGTAR